MAKFHAEQELPAYVLRGLRVLERYSGKIPLSRAVAGIVLFGLVLTLLVTGAVWQANRQRDLQDFESVFAQVQSQSAQRLSHRRWMLARVDVQASDPRRPVGLGWGFDAGDVQVISPRDGPVPRLAALWKLDDAGRGVVETKERPGPKCHRQIGVGVGVNEGTRLSRNVQGAVDIESGGLHGAPEVEGALPVHERRSRVILVLEEHDRTGPPGQRSHVLDRHGGAHDEMTGCSMVGEDVRVHARTRGGDVQRWEGARR